MPFLLQCSHCLWGHKPTSGLATTKIEYEFVVCTDFRIRKNMPHLKSQNEIKMKIFEGYLPVKYWKTDERRMLC